MTFNEYQNKAIKTAIYPDKGNNFTYTVLGLTGEAGEVADKYKKVIRDSSGVMSPAQREELIKELGDVLWYIANCCQELRINLDDVANLNIEKLYSRQKRHKLAGSGDNR
jgi:NTP pyrophosphatase (non-canonical NTP hydrolase)